MRTPICTFVLCAFLGVVPGCEGRPSEDAASIQQRLSEKKTVDVMDQVSKAPAYQPPAHGHLTGRQVEMYLDVRRREQKIRQVAKAAGDLADVAIADLRAALELGYNPREYSWIKDRVLEAEMMQTAQALSQQMVQGRQAFLQALNDQRNAAVNPAKRAEIERQIAELESSPSGDPPGSDPDKRFNAELVARYKGELDSIEAEEQQRMSEKLQDSSKGGQSGR